MPSRPYTFPVEAGHIMLFARAVNDPNPAYAGEPGEPGGVIAPPTFVQAGAHWDPDFPLRPTPGEPWIGSGKEPTGLPPKQASGGGTALHGEQHYEYHRPVRAGDVLTATNAPGKTWEKTNRSGNTLYFSDIVTEYRDATGELVVTARTVVVSTAAPEEKP